MSAAETQSIGRGSYLVNGVAGCGGCHGSEAGHLAGGREFALPFIPPDAEGRTSFFARNLTPHEETGMLLTEDEFVAAMVTGIDFHDSEGRDPQRMLIMPVQAYRYMLRSDLNDIYAYLRAIPAVDNEVQREYVMGFPFPPIPGPTLSDDDIERGLQIPEIFSAGPEGDSFAASFAATIGGLNADERTQVGRGSYLLNAIADCSNCHTDGLPDGGFDGGLLPGTVSVNAATYLGGGVNVGFVFGLTFPVFTRNLTPHPETGLELTQEEFVDVMRFGADFRRPGGSLRVQPHFPAEFRMTLEDIHAIYAYLQAIPAVNQEVTITP
ncbi:MAG: hypothetical protein HOI33_11320 [Rhodospirillaceae bacterium]|nr:hypothetical protein [Rhodospirillaceae bacterium]